MTRKFDGSKIDKQILLVIVAISALTTKPSAKSSNPPRFVRHLFILSVLGSASIVRVSSRANTRAVVANDHEQIAPTTVRRNRKMTTTMELMMTTMELMTTTTMTTTTRRRTKTIVTMLKKMLRMAERMMEPIL